MKKLKFRAGQKGYGYKSISSILKVKRDDVRDFCKSKGLSGYLGYGKSVISASRVKEKNYLEKCQQCGKEINKTDRIGESQSFALTNVGEFVEKSPRK
jgi:hypothetical protein